MIVIWRFLAGLSILLLPAVGAAEAAAEMGPFHWDLNDVTYLLPLPTAATWNDYLHPTDPQRLALSEPWMRENFLDAYFSNLRFTGAEFSEFTAIAFRIDPCFRDKFVDLCRPQVRVSWQPFVQRKSGRYGIDISLHTFHDLSAEEFRALAERLKNLPRSSDTRQLPLGIHPEMRIPNATRFQRRLMAAFLPVLGQRTFSRIALFTNGPVPLSWGVASFNVVHGEISHVDIPVGEDETVTEQSFQSRSENWRKLDVVMGEIGSTEVDQLGDLSKRSGEPFPADEAAKIFRAATRAENPRFHLSGTVDCISCHFSDAAQRSVGLAKSALLPGDRFVDSVMEFDVTNASRRTGNSKTLRSVGYLGREFVLIDRVIFESAEVARQMNEAKF